MEFLAHQGGWDEALLVAIPVMILAGLLYVADRRSRASDDTHGESTEVDSADLAS